MVWDWVSGRLHCEIPIWEKVEEFVAVKVKPYKRKENGKEKKTREGTEVSEGVVDGTTDVVMTSEEKEEATPQPVVDEEEKVLVVQNINTLESEDGKRWILFSVVGYDI
jgi:tRNA (guanine-N(7)-)-methyltransferase subunit TRM82